ncbi:ester cyclase [Agaribacter flavus]|uniref:Ester cyclase n=1 Tax=Agaribacter flavus TaxID=1902781 RepID=A0ABV7FUH0_9ALTE
MISSCQHATNKRVIHTLSKAMYDFNVKEVTQLIKHIFADKPLLQMCYPFETMESLDSWLNDVLLTLHEALPDIERRDNIIISGEASDNGMWVGCNGNYTGTFTKPWLGIPPTGRSVSMRYTEFYRFVDDKIVEMQAIWDIPELMMQAEVWPLSPSIGREWQVPGPATQDGLSLADRCASTSMNSLKIVSDMCTALGNHASGGVDAMRLEEFWHPKCSWYGPAGIGSTRTIAGFRHCHQIPFLNGLPDRGPISENHKFFADNNYVAVTGWPAGMRMTVSDAGWLGIAPGRQKITMRSLDFWRVQNGLIRENWVLIDLLSVYAQLNVDVLARMKEMTSKYI